MTVASFNPMLEFMTSHLQSSSSSSSSSSSGDDSGEDETGNEGDTASVATLTNNNNDNTTPDNNSSNTKSIVTQSDSNNIHHNHQRQDTKKNKKILKDLFPGKHLFNSTPRGSESLQQPALGSVDSGDAGVVGVGPNNHFEFVVEKIFTDYKNLFQKEYKDPKEHVKRKDIFRHNLRYIFYEAKKVKIFFFFFIVTSEVFTQH